ncbi:sugar ABC transporter permease [Paenibacillus sp.]|uniref:carbohydrate ABC transporter permease n=1 Tax=Paenibacillus sp. TaxID=58172 RepID=UPI002D36280C|nr:sugar ABC transporter permease [Paenibacillus sp.]HZG88111.1 sugar ABC transporter permease [Paenibacillus sp.]
MQPALPGSVRTSIGSRVKDSIRRNLPGYVFLTPWLIGILAFSAVPMFTSLYLSFTNYDLFRAPEWIGLQNYAQVFTDDSRYLKSLKVTFLYVFLGVPLKLVFALFIATLLNKGIRGLPFIRAVYYIPSLLGGSVAIAILWRQVFGMDGILNAFLSIFGIQGTSWVSNPNYAVYTLIALLIWQFGSPMIIFLAGLKQIPSELYESASIDGAGKTATFFKITLPLLTPIILFNLVMQMISAFQAFTPAYIIGGQNGGALDSLLFYTLYLYTKAFSHFQMGYASAMAWILLVVISLFTAIVFLSSKKWVHYSD